MKKLETLNFRKGSQDDQIVYKELVIDDMYQFKYLRKLTNIYENWVCIDGGGHIGIFSLLLAESVNGKIYTYEPNPDSYHRCKENTKEYKNITVLQQGIDYKDDYIKLYPPVNLKETGTWSMVPTEKHNKEKPIYVKTVNIIDFISDARQEGNNILLKLDLEGYEAAVIDNMQDDHLRMIKILILEEHGCPINHDRLNKIGFYNLYHPLGSSRHFVYFNAYGENELVKELLEIKRDLSDKYYSDKINYIKKMSRITTSRLLKGLINKFIKR
ncbi:MAG: hypothetical protein CMN32_12935 [Saprospirales bacterium]|nr:hypothetical protein [Saprospirales bacterium]